MSLHAAAAAVDHPEMEINNVYPPPPDSDICWIDTVDSNIVADRTFLTQHWNNHADMVKYNIAMIQAMVSVKPTGPIDNTRKRPIFSTLWHLQHQLIDGKLKLGNVKFTLDGHAGYILSKETLTLFLSKEWREPEEVGDYDGIPIRDITYKKQQTEENKWKIKNRRDRPKTKMF